MAPPVTNPHDTGLSWTCEACDPSITIYATTQRELDKEKAAHMAQYHA